MREIDDLLPKLDPLVQAAIIDCCRPGRQPIA